MESKITFNEDGSLKIPEQHITAKALKARPLNFLKDEQFEKPKRKFWNLYINNSEAEPLTFSNGKTQEDVVKEIHDLVKKGSKVIFLKGACGTGKSAIALNLARLLGKTSIIVPIKNLQRQYEEDYTSEKFLVKPNGMRLKIAVLTGKDNHASRFISNASCADPELPENIDIREARNYGKVQEYFDSNPNNNNQIMPDLWQLGRFKIAPANPYWSPILPAGAEPAIDYNEKIEYNSSNGDKCIFYWRKKGCGYYDQYAAYAKADVLVFNSAKYLAELAAERKPATEVEIFDEGDEFLDKLFRQKTINLNRLLISLSALPVVSDENKEIIGKMIDLLGLELKNKQVLGVAEGEIYPIHETKLKELFKLFNSSKEINYEISINPKNYAKDAFEAASDLKDVLDEVYLTYSKKEGDIYANLACTNISSRIERIKNNSKVLIFMSGTIHSEEILRTVFGFKEFDIVEAETINPGSANLVKTGMEFKCDYSGMRSNRDHYLRALNTCIAKAKPPVLVHVGAFSDLPSKEEQESLSLDVISHDDLRSMQDRDKQGENIIDFKSGRTKILYSTRANRGMDFPGEICNSIIFTKYQYPNIGDVFWKILHTNHPNIYWDFYKDKAWREFQQRLYRALRSKEDKVFVLSPDIRVLSAIQKL